MANISIFIGTKAQFIKVAPIIQELDARAIPYRLIDSCQHKDITQDLRKLFGVRQPDVYLETGFANINTIPRALLWVLKIMAALLFSRRAFRQKVFGTYKGGICLIHGDTLSTLLGLIIAKCSGLKVGHLEAGLRSFDIFNPFPEELIRLICTTYADYLFAPSLWAEQNLKNMKIKKPIFNIGDNTVVDSIQRMLPLAIEDSNKQATPYVVLSVHRFENIYRRARLSFIVELAQELSKDYTVIFIAHQPTLKRLTRTKLIDRLNNKPIQIVSLERYERFLSLLLHAQFVLTDGGSIQEESYYLNKPCLLLRMKTERNYGLGENACLSEFKPGIIRYFFDNYTSFKRKQINETARPSAKIATILAGIP